MEVMLNNWAGIEEDPGCCRGWECVEQKLDGKEMAEDKESDDTEMVQEEDEKLESDVNDRFLNFFELEETLWKIKIWDKRKGYP